jgi:hypothetical protein
MNQPITVISDKATHFHSGAGVVVVIDGTVHVSQGARAVVVGAKALAHIIGTATVSAYGGARVISHTAEGVIDLHDISTLVAHAGVAYLYDEARVEVPAVADAPASAATPPPLVHLFGISTATIAAPASVFLHDLSTATVEVDSEKEVAVTQRSEATTVEWVGDGTNQHDSGRHAAAESNTAEQGVGFPSIPAPPAEQLGVSGWQQPVRPDASVTTETPDPAGGPELENDTAPAPDLAAVSESAPQEVSLAVDDRSPYGDPTEWAPEEWVGITEPTGPVVRYDDVAVVEGEAIREFEGIADPEGDSTEAGISRADVGVVEELPDLSKLPSARLVPPGM